MESEGKDIVGLNHILKIENKRLAHRHILWNKKTLLIGKP